MRISTDSSGLQADVSDSYTPFDALSANGRYVAFYSAATNLVPGDTNGKGDIFVKDSLTGATTRISTGSSEEQANGQSNHPAISADGRYVAFYSAASNFILNDTNPDDVFLKDRYSGAISMISTSSSGAHGNWQSWNPSISSDGRYVAFTSSASNLVSGDTNSKWDVFMKDTLTGILVRVSTDSAGNQAVGGDSASPTISPDGRYVLFYSGATNLVPGDTNGVVDLFMKDLVTGVTTRISTDSYGAEANSDSGANQLGVTSAPAPSISGNDRYVAFDSFASNLVPSDTNGKKDIFVKDLTTGSIVRASTDSSGIQANNNSAGPNISFDGRYVSMDSYASNLVPSDTNSEDIFIKDLSTNLITRLSTDASGTQANGISSSSALSANASRAAFYSSATNLVPGDTNGIQDAFLAGTPASDSCISTRPAISLSLSKAYWASFSDYSSRSLSVDFSVANGNQNVLQLQASSSHQTNGVTQMSAMPLSLGNLAPDAARVFTIKYAIPTAVNHFTVSINATADDYCGTEYTYP